MKVIPPANRSAQKLANQQKKPKKPPRSELLKIWLQQKEKERKAIKTKKRKYFLIASESFVDIVMVDFIYIFCFYVLPCNVLCCFTIKTSADGELT